MIDDQEHMPDEDWAKLKKLILLARTEVDDSFTRPTDDSILAYLMGQADEEQTGQVRAAMIANRGFRREIADLGKVVSEIGEAVSQDQKSGYDSVPERMAFLQERAGRHRGDADKRQENRGIFHLKTLRTWIPLAAAAAVIFVILSQTVFQPSPIQYAKWQVEPKAIDKPLLISLSTRAIETDTVAHSYPVARDAAISAFKSALEYDFYHDRFEVFSSSQFSLSDTSQSGYVLVLNDAAGKRDTSVIIPIPLKHSGQDLLWSLQLPSRLLGSTPASDTINIATSRLGGGDLLFVITYLVGDQYAASRVVYRKSENNIATDTR